MRIAAIISLLPVYTFSVLNVYANEQPDEAWLDDDSEWRALQVNEGQLKFIEPIKDKLILHSDTHFWITEDSLQHGWLKMEQCYRHLDAVGRTDVVYQYQDMKQLKVESFNKISSARVSDGRVEIEDVLPGAELCVSASVKLLKKNEPQEYSLEVGPYHRKFFDGYYPYHVTMNVYFPEKNISLKSVYPEAQVGLKIVRHSDSVSIDAWFEGSLSVRVVFQEIK